jgi:hypothetical protein
MGVKVIIRDVYHNYFQRGGDRVDYLKFDNLLEGWCAYKRMKSHEFNYGDAWYEVSIRLRVPVREDKPQRPHARSEWKWKDLQAHKEHERLSEEELAYLLSFDEDDDDEEIII